MRITDVNPYTPSSVRSRGSRHTEKTLDRLLTEYLGVESAVVSSARAGIHLILGQLQLTKRNHVLIPDFLCGSVHYILNQQGFSVRKPDNRTKAVFLLHQWGYPQKMEFIMAEAKKRGWFVIEDCAHTFGGSYRGQKLGSFGDAAVFSISKFFPTYTGGAIVSRRDDVIERARQIRRKPRSSTHRAYDILSMKTAREFYLLHRPPLLFKTICINAMYFPRISSEAMARFPRTVEEVKSAIAKRQFAFEELKKQVGSDYYPRHLEEGSEIVPFCMPVFLPEAKLTQAKEMLAAKHIKADILHFDVNRNTLDPRYIKCLALPCHQFVTDEELGHMCDVIRRV